ncbi:MAG: hypothetical protein ACTSRK_02800 [Promethearchaeota archaeon]
MPKHNPKHKKSSRSRKITPQHGKNPSKALKLASQMTIRGIPRVPRFPTPNKLRHIQRKFRDLLMRIEMKIMEIYSTYNYLSDSNVLEGLSFILWEKLHWKSHTAKKPQACDYKEEELQGLAFTVYISIDELCEDILKENEILSVQNVWDCLACIFDSVRFWTNQNGSFGYLEYVSQFIPPNMVMAMNSDLNQFAKTGFGVNSTLDFH